MRDVDVQGRRVVVTYDPAGTSPEEIARGIEASGVDTVSKIEPLTAQAAGRPPDQRRGGWWSGIC